MTGGVRYFVGLDLAQAQEFTALAVLERPRVYSDSPRELRRPPYALRHLRRFPLGTPYAEVAAELLTLLRTPALQGACVAADQTGVGKAVVDLLRDRLRGQVSGHLYGVTVTAGHEVGVGEGGAVLVPRKELVGTLQVLLQTRRLHVAQGLPEAALLARELESFKARVTAAGQKEAVEAWREGEHDDLVLAVAVTAWLGELGLPPVDDPPGDRYPTRLVT